MEEVLAGFGLTIDAVHKNGPESEVGRCRVVMLQHVIFSIQARAGFRAIGRGTGS
jgi:hypothetical protein